MDDLSELFLLLTPVSSTSLIETGVTSEGRAHVSKREEYGYQWRDFHGR
jgi:hypothetical protein